MVRNTTMREAFINIKVAQSAYTTKGEAIGSRVYENIRTKVGVIPFRDQWNLR